MENLSGISLSELIRVAKEIKLLQAFGRIEVRQITVEYFPPRESMFSVHAADAEAEPITPTNGYSITYTLEDAMFGGVVYAAITSEGFVVVEPFRWVSHADLLNKEIA